MVQSVVFGLCRRWLKSNNESDMRGIHKSGPGIRIVLAFFELLILQPN